MRINTKFKLRDIAGETIIVNQGTPEADLTRIISLNASARLLWNELSGKDFLTEDAAEILMEHYPVSEETAQEDATVWVDALRKCGIISDD
ncbi:PqqD family protein [Phocaeicola faecalis]|uniref:PqqD family protein n=1 Tax=Phocaeicola faecalis TaxID=2786956 RepID=UPI001F339CE1|nr:PqqD family protein [Phocaeicola faecalis]